MTGSAAAKARANSSSEPHTDQDAKHFVMHDFNEAAVSLLKKTQAVLSKCNSKLHKITKKNKEVIAAFPSKDHASGLNDLDLDADALPIQHSLRLKWNLQTDSFHFDVSDGIKPYTQRGVLSTINSIYDPLGFISPFKFQDKAILRELTIEKCDWDSPLLREMEELSELSPDATHKVHR